MVLRWGIASAGKLANDFVNAIQSIPDSQHKVVAVGCKSQDRSNAFAKAHNIPKAYLGYLPLAEDDEIDIVFVAAVIPHHYPIVRCMLFNDKHVLCGTTVAVAYRHLLELVQCAKRRQLFLREATWSRDFPAYHEIRRQIKSGSIGQIKHVRVEIGFKLEKMDRLKIKALGASSVLEVGVHALQFIHFVFRDSLLQDFRGFGTLSPIGVDESFTCTFRFANGSTGVVSGSILYNMNNEAVIYGSKGKIRVPEFWCPTKIKVNGLLYEFEPLIENKSVKYHYQNAAGFSYIAEDTRRCIEQKKIESEHMTFKDSLQLLSTTETLRRMVGNLFPEDHASTQTQTERRK